ncbi:transposase [Microbulbifer sp. OS29]|uniref:Transposase n=1 Tax=Microbulbifer okhotskensis TaxID=2926617 RepID=A0A9X2EPE5_9GAMM|nr:transposase [Microbulbifer okhotskensis]MCO1335989.1 transposase [Microbulbifer okhotskensis]
MFKPIKDGKKSHALLYSTDTELDAMTLIAYYKSRFQIEFLFGAAKQHTGLAHCQSTRKEAINLHVNASMTALNLQTIADRNTKQTDEATVISIVSWKRPKFNQSLMDRVFDELDLDQSCGKLPAFTSGTVTAGLWSHEIVRSITILSACEAFFIACLNVLSPFPVVV